MNPRPRSAADQPGPGPVARSTRMDLQRRLDELDLPRYRERVSHLGWEVRTKHFVVVASTTRRDAVRTAQIMATAWEDMGALADQWTDLHRRETFGVAAVSVWVVDGGRRSRRPASGKGEGAEPADMIFVDLSDGGGSIEDRVIQLRGKTVDAFFRVSRQEQALPGWVRTGLAAYVSGQQPAWRRVGRLEPPRPGKGSGDTAQSALWVRYLLEADDARLAPRFFEAMASAIAAAPRTVHEAQRPRRIASGVTPDHLGAYPAFERLTTEPRILDGANDWLSDPMSGQPIVQLETNQPRLHEGHRRMVLILKLARRFSTETEAAPGAKVREFNSDDSRFNAPADVELGPVMSITELRRRLWAAPRWATIDTDGRLLVSNDRDRLAEILGDSDPDVAYRTLALDGHAVLEATFARWGETYRAWLEENPQNPNRPIARVRRIHHPTGPEPVAIRFEGEKLVKE